MSLSTPLKFLAVPALEKHTATVIFVHGLGDTGRGCKPVADALKNDPGLKHVKWVLPHSPARSVTASAGEVMPSWFDIYSFSFDGEEDESGMLQSSRQLNELISTEMDAGIGANRIVIAGFSQGGTMSLLTGLTSERKLAGVAVLSGWLPLRKKFQKMLSRHATSIPIFWGHGTADPLVRYQLCKEAVDHLTSRCGLRLATDKEVNGIRCKPYEGMAHLSSTQELEDLKTWLKAIVPKAV